MAKAPGTVARKSQSKGKKSSMGAGSTNLSYREYDNPYYYSGYYHGYGSYGVGSWGYQHRDPNDFTEADGMALGEESAEAFEQDMDAS